MGYNHGRKLWYYIGCTTTNPAASTEYWIGLASEGFGTAAGQVSAYQYSPVSGTILDAICYQTNSNAATSEDWTITILSAATDYTFDTVGVAGQERIFENHSLSIPVAKDDVLRFHTTTPAWVTPPTAVRMRGYLLISY